MTLEDKFRKQATLFLEKMNEARRLFSNHKPSIGYVGEEVLRQALKRIIPNDFDVCQGFVINKNSDEKNNFSGQCDVIIFHKVNDAVVYSIGDLKIVDACYVVAVIEVKSSIRKDAFLTTLKAFEKLNQLGVTNSFIFVFGSISKQSIERWFFQYKCPKNSNDDWIIMDRELYDWSDKEWLPNAILSLKSSKYYKLTHYQDDNDWVGFVSYRIIDRIHKEVSCIQEFFSTIMDLINEKPIKIDINKYSIKDGFPLFRM